jgi:uncharacterized membrane protein
MINRRHLIIITFLAFIARVPLLANPMWYDEQYTLLLSRLPFTQMLAATAGDVHPPLHYIITWCITQLGGAPWTLRLPSVLASLVSIWLLASILQTMKVDNRVIYAAVLLMAFAPLQIHYATEGRMYAIMMCLYLLGVWLIVEGFDYFWLMVVITLLAYTHNWGLFYGATLGIYAFIIAEDHTERIEVFLACVVAAGWWLPWANVILGQMGTINQTYWITRVSAGQIVYQLYQTVWSVTLGNPVALVVCSGWLIMGLWLSSQRRNAWQFVLLSMLPLSMAVAVSLAWQPVLLFRAYIGLAPFIYVILAYGILAFYDDAMLNTRRVLIALIVFAPLVMLSTYNLYNNIRGDQSIYPRLASMAQPGDVIVTSNDGGLVGMAAVTDKSSILIEACKPSMGALSTATRAAMGFDIRKWEDVPSGRVWLLWAQTPLVAKCEQDLYHQIIGDVKPVIVIEDTEMIKTALYLLEK